MHIIIALLIMISWCHIIVASFTDFHLTQGYRVVSGIVEQRVADCVSECVMLCSISTSCLVASYSSSSNECLLSSSWYTDPIDFKIVEDSTFILLRKSTPTRLHDDPNHWHLAFRAHAKSGHSIWDTWTNAGHHDDEPSVYFHELPLGCVTVSNDLYCDRLYRSQMLDDWNNIEQVQIAFFTNGTRVSYVTFNASSSKNQNDFVNPGRMLNSSITELVDDYDGVYRCFSATGCPSYTDRRFMLARSFNGCTKDSIWFLVGGPGEFCSWETESDGAYPIFLYTLSGYSERFYSTEPGRADVFAVFIKKSNQGEV